jgi:hypothetical protein
MSYRGLIEQLQAPGLNSNYRRESVDFSQLEDRANQPERYPRIEPNGAHVIPIVSMKDFNNKELPFTSGQITWSPEAGLRCDFDFDYVIDDLLDHLRGRDDSCSVGILVLGPPKLCWIAYSANGAAFSAYGFDGTRTIQHSTHSVFGQPTIRRAHTIVKGTATFVIADLPIDNIIAFDQFEPELTRSMLIGFSCGVNWPQSVATERLCADGSQRNCGYGKLELSDAPRTVVLGIESTTRLCDSAFVCYEQEKPVTNEDALADYGQRDQDFFSFIWGSPTQVYWKEWTVDSSTIRRIYFGRKKQFIPPDMEFEFGEPIPLSQGIEMFEYGKVIVERLPDMYRKFVELPDEIVFSTYLTPIWLALRTYMDERVTLASIGIERFVRATDCLIDKVPSVAVLDATQWKRTFEAFLETLEALDSEGVFEPQDASKKERKAFVAKKLQNINSPPNADKLALAFSILGIALTKSEVAALGRRNDAMHGKVKLSAKSQFEDYQKEIDTFEALRMLLTKGTLKLLGYAGPYIDYASRPASGNYTVAIMESGPANEALTT